MKTINERTNMPKGIKKETPDKEVSVAIVAENKELGNFNAETLIAQAINSKVPVETMERLLAMAEKMQAIKAKQEFDKAMANFQANCPTIEKQKEVKNDTGKVLYKYAPIDNIISQVKVLLQENGFSYSTNMELLENGVKVFVKVTHIMGHSEVTEMNVPLGVKTGIMSASQQVAAAQTFAKRYAFLNAFGIMTGDEDNDGANLEPTKEESFPASEKQLAYIDSLILQKNVSEETIFDAGFNLKNLTGGKEGTAGELITYLLEYKGNRQEYTGKIEEPTEGDRVVKMFTKDLEECTTPEMYTKVANEIKIARDNGKLVGVYYDMVLKTAKVIAQKIQDSINNLETKPKSEAAQAMLKGIEKAKAKLS